MWRSFQLTNGPGLIGLAVALSGCAAALPATPDESVPATLADTHTGPSAPPGNLPPWMRPIVRSQMAGLGGRVNELRWAAAALEFERTAELARTLAQEAHTGRPLDAHETAESVIPAPYLALQNELRQRAQRLAFVADSENRRDVSSAYGALVETCARCHAAYIAGAAVAVPTLTRR